MKCSLLFSFSLLWETWPSGGPILDDESFRIGERCVRVTLPSGIYASGEEPNSVNMIQLMTYSISNITQNSYYNSLIIIATRNDVILIYMP